MSSSQPPVTWHLMISLLCHSVTVLGFVPGVLDELLRQRDVESVERRHSFMVLQRHLSQPLCLPPLSVMNKGQCVTKYYRWIQKNSGYIWIQSSATIAINTKNAGEKNIIWVNYVLRLVVTFSSSFTYWKCQNKKRHLVRKWLNDHFISNIK